MSKSNKNKIRKQPSVTELHKDKEVKKIRREVKKVRREVNSLTLKPAMVGDRDLILSLTITEDVLTINTNDKSVSYGEFEFNSFGTKYSKDYQGIACEDPLHPIMHSENTDTYDELDGFPSHRHIRFKNLDHGYITSKDLQKFLARLEDYQNNPEWRRSNTKEFSVMHQMLLRNATKEQKQRPINEIDNFLSPGLSVPRLDRCLLFPNMSAPSFFGDSFYLTQHTYSKDIKIREPQKFMLFSRPGMGYLAVVAAFFLVIHWLFLAPSRKSRQETFEHSPGTRLAR